MRSAGNTDMIFDQYVSEKIRSRFHVPDPGQYILFLIRGTSTDCASLKLTAPAVCLFNVQYGELAGDAKHYGPARLRFADNSEWMLVRQRTELAHADLPAGDGRSFRVVSSFGLNVYLMRSETQTANLCSEASHLRTQYKSDAINATSRASGLVQTVNSILISDNGKIHSHYREIDLSRIYSAKDIIDMSISDDISIPEIARRAGLSQRVLSDGFKHVHETTLSEYIKQKKLETAYSLPERGDLSVASVAQRVGYTPPYLSVAFRERFGCSPRAIKQRRPRLNDCHPKAGTL